MTLRPAAVALCVALLSPVSALAQSEVQFVQSVASGLKLGGDARYKLAEKRANQALDNLKVLRDYANEVKDRSEALRKEMHENRYDDMVNTRLVPLLSDARSYSETVGGTYKLEKDNVKTALGTARGGDFGPIDAAIARINATEVEYEPRVKDVDVKVNGDEKKKIAGIRQVYGRHYGDAQRALAQFNGLPLVQDLVNAKPKLVKKIELAPEGLRPLVWSIVLEKQQRDSNDPRFKELPTEIQVPNGAQEKYNVVIR